MKLPPAIASVTGQVLSSDTTGNLSWLSIPSSASSTLNSGYIYVGNASNVATGVAASQDATLSNTGAFTITGLRGRTISSTAPSNGQILKYVTATTTWTPANFGASDLLTATGTSQFASASCATNQTLTWTSLTNTFTCANIAGLDAATITTGSIDAARLPASATAWTISGSDIYRGSGNVGIGTSTPTSLLDVRGSISAGGLGVQGVAATNSGNADFSIRSLSGTGYWDFATRNSSGLLTIYDAANNKTPISIETAAPDNALYIRSSGDVGIGTASAGAPLQVGPSINNNIQFQPDGNTILSAGYNGDSRVLISGNVGNSFGIGAGTGGIRLGGGSTYSYVIGAGTNLLLNPSAGNVGIGITSPSARLHLPASTAGAGSAAIKLNTGTLMTSPEAGAIEYDGTNLYYTDSTSARKTLSTSAGSSFTGVTSIANSSGNITLAPQSSSGSVVVNSGTTSTSSNTGSLVVTGGAGVSGSLFAGTAVTAPSLNATTSLLTPQIYGSSANSGTLKIDGTSSATKGFVLLNSAGGNVGVATTTPANTFDVNGAVAIGSYAGASANGNSLVVSGNAGIGTNVTSPYKLHLQSGTDARVLLAEGSPSGNAALLFMMYNGVGSANWGNKISLQGGGSEKYSFGNDYAGNGSQNFFIFDGVNSNYPFFIGSTGNVGIGTTTPTASLSVVAPAVSVAYPGGLPNSFSVSGANNSSNGAGGGISLTAGTGNSGFSGASLVLSGGSYANGGSISLLAGQNGGGGAGTVTISGSDGNFSGDQSGGIVAIRGGNATGNNNVGGKVTVTGGAAGATNAKGADVEINGGVKAGTGSDGNVILAATRGNVGVRTSSPRTTLDVNGAIAGAPAVSNSTATIDFSNGNIQYTASSCQAFALNNMKNGASYMFIVKGATAATCSFSSFSDAGSTAMTVHMPPGHGSTTASTHTMYNFVVVGTDVYASWIPGY